MIIQDIKPQTGTHVPLKLGNVVYSTRTRGKFIAGFFKKFIAWVNFL